MTLFSIIIPVKEINDYIRETVLYIFNLDRDDWELLIVTNEQSKNEWVDERVKILISGRVGPGKKRDLGADKAVGKYLVFLDDDSFPETNLLSVAKLDFENNKVVALGGPAITPRSDSMLQKVSGAVFLSKYSGGFPERYVPIGEKKFVDDWPSVNLMVEKEAFLNAGGFDSAFWPGEDTKLCHALVVKGGGRIMYDPELVVWHHRREGLFHHLNQVGAYGLHRGYFAKKYPDTSLRMKYFIPSFFVIYSFCLLFIMIWNGTNYILWIPMIFYIGSILMSMTDIAKYENWKVTIYAVPYIVLTHYWYGYKFIVGLFKSDLVSRLR